MINLFKNVREDTINIFKYTGKKATDIDVADSICKRFLYRKKGKDKMILNFNKVVYVTEEFIEHIIKDPTEPVFAFIFDSLEIKNLPSDFTFSEPFMKKYKIYKVKDFYWMGTLFSPPPSKLFPPQ